MTRNRERIEPVPGPAAPIAGQLDLLEWVTEQVAKAKRRHPATPKAKP